VETRLAVLTSSVVALLGLGATAQALSLEVPPANLVPPAVTGVPTVGQPLSCSQGVWAGPPTSYAYQWTRAGADISGAGSASYTVAPADAGQLVRCRVKASNSMGNASATSPPVLGLATGETPGTTSPPPGGGTGPGTSPALPRVTEVIRLPASSRCVSRRKFRIRIKKVAGMAGVKIAAVAVYVNGKVVKVARGKRLSAPIDLRGLPRGTATVRIEAATADGRRMTHTRKYRTCAKRPAPRRKHKL
jgi:hypothetical protein